MRKSRTVITVETEEVWIVRNRRTAVRTWCSECGRQTTLVTLAEAVALGGVSSRVIYRRVESGGIHYSETPSGLLLFCANSLPKEVPAISKLDEKQKINENVLQSPNSVEDKGK